MFSAAIYLELGEQPPTESILRQHSAHSALDKALGPRLANLSRGRRTNAARPFGMPKVHLVGLFAPGELHLRRIDYHDEIARVFVRSEVGTMLPPQQACGAARDPAQDSVGSIDDEPSAIPQRALA